MKLILCGGGSGEQNTIANKKLNSVIDHSKPLLYVPLAMDEFDHPYDSCYEWIKEELSAVELISIDMVRSFDELASKDLKRYCAIFIGGGNTYKLLNGLKQSGTFEKMKEYINNNGVVIGGSAGAVIFGKDINIINSMDPNDCGLKDTTGFDMLNGISIFPHYTNTKSKLTEEENNFRLRRFTESIIEFSKTIGDVIAIPEENAVYVDESNFEVIGSLPYYQFKDGIMEKHTIKTSKSLK